MTWEKGLVVEVAERCGNLTFLIIGKQLLTMKLPWVLQHWLQPTCHGTFVHWPRKEGEC